MADGSPAPLLYGPYHPPTVRPGDWLDDEIDGLVAVGGYSNGRIPWPRRKKTGRHSLILCGDLVKAVRAESSEAIQHAFGVGAVTVWKWRQALDVGAVTDGTRRLLQERTGVPPEAAARGRARAAEPDAIERMAQSKRGKPAPTATRRALAMAARRPRSAMTPDDLRQWRYRLGFSVSEAARALGVTYRTIRMYESGARGMRHHVAMACSAIYYDLDGAPPMSVRAWRKARGWSQSRLAAAIGFTVNGVSLIELHEIAGKPAPLMQRLALQAIAAGLKPWYRIRPGMRDYPG